MRAASAGAGCGAGAGCAAGIGGLERGAVKVPVVAGSSTLMGADVAVAAGA
jgi:hypothetical protein